MSTNPSPDPMALFPHVSMANTLGAGLISLAASFLLNGLLIHQTYRYYREYPDDQRFLKIWVFTVVILQIFISAAHLHFMWFYLVQLYWDPTYIFLHKTVWSLNVSPIAASITALCSQTFFIRRLWLLAPQFKVIAAIAFLLNAGNVGCFITLAVKMFQTPSIVAALGFSWLASVAVSIQMAGDIILTLSLIHVFRQSRTGIEKTDSMLEVMIAYAIGTGAVNCIGHILTVAFSIAYPREWIYGLFSAIDAKLYAIGFLVALDSRKFLAITRFSGESTGPRFLSTWKMKSSAARSAMRMPSVTSTPTAIQLKVVREEIVEDDSGMRSKHPSVTGMVA